MATHPVQSFYSQKAKLYYFFFIRLLRWEKVLTAFFQENQYLRPGIKILDAGCGTGSVTKVLYQLAQRLEVDGITYHAFDLTPAMLELFRQWVEREGVKRIRMQQADVLNLENELPRDWTGYDLIVSSAMFEYISRDKLGQALSNLKRLLGENGRLLIFVTRQNQVTRWLGSKWWGTNLFDREEFILELQQAGYIGIQEKKLPESWNAFMMAIEARAVNK